MATRCLSELPKLSQHQLNAIRKEDLIQIILNAPEPEGTANEELKTKLTIRIPEVADVKKTLSPPNTGINKQFMIFRNR